MISGFFVKIALIPFDILDHEVFASEFYMVGEMIDKLIITWKRVRVVTDERNSPHSPNRVPLSGEKSARTLCTFAQ